MGSMWMFGGGSDGETTEHMNPAVSSDWTWGFKLRDFQFFGCSAKVSPHEVVLITDQSRIKVKKSYRYDIPSGNVTVVYDHPPSPVSHIGDKINILTNYIQPDTKMPSLFICISFPKHS